ncbi:hypothetical protein DCAR_0520037 [Daucus carota subsp. sativus]|uniref:EamA domain-containing protein n=1 Tax=Daucus carota subsp. sativus TaxID=79200 RepID=A0AAF1AZ33_DAUCS|nr:hypothetical protein DCAR_0520037 [Daucus carota subsp. sativus]
MEHDNVDAFDEESCVNQVSLVQEKHAVVALLRLIISILSFLNTILNFVTCSLHLIQPLFFKESRKFFFVPLVKYGLVIFFNVLMWGCYVNSLKALSSLQATVTNFAINFLTSGLAGFFLFEEALSFKWFAGASLIVVGVLLLSKSSIEKKSHAD